MALDSAIARGSTLLEVGRNCMESETKRIPPSLARAAQMEGKTPRAYLEAYLEKYGTKTAAADALLISVRTMHTWCEAAGVRGSYVFKPA